MTRLKRITIEEFRKHRDLGMPISDMPKTLGVSKSQIWFLSAMDQGKFNHITKEDFQRDYLSGMSLKEIAGKNNVSNDYISFLRAHLDIKRLGHKFINRKKTELPLTQRQKELIYGTLMGDGCRQSPASIKIKQSSKQRAFVMWKLSELQEHVSLGSIKEESYYDTRYNNTYKNIRFYTNANTEIEQINYQFYKDGSKVVTQEILNQLTPLSIAVWFMDDGVTDWYLRYAKKGWNANPSAKICTDSFTLDEVELICQWFKSRWGIASQPVVRNKNKGHFRTFFSTTEFPKLQNLISEHIIPSMLYKVDCDAYLKKQQDTKGPQKRIA